MENKMGFTLMMAEFFRLRLVINRIMGIYLHGPGEVRKLREIQVGKQVGGGNLRRYITLKYNLNDCTQVGVIKKNSPGKCRNKRVKIIRWNIGTLDRKCTSSGIKNICI
jgi:hypothetical protein